MRNNILVIGSVALKKSYNDYMGPVRDTDYICKKEYFNNFGFKGAIVKLKENYATVKYPNSRTSEYLFSDGIKSLELILDTLCGKEIYCPIEILYSLKKAHISFPIKFDKHIKDLMFMREKLRLKKKISLEQDLNSLEDLLDTYPTLTSLHYIETEKRLGKLKTPKMNNTVEEFFGKSKKFVKSFYIHDNMHLAMAHEKGYPQYMKIIKKMSQVETDVNLWITLTLQEKIWCVLEEVYVIALERKILPTLFENDDDRINFTEREAFDWALMRVCTTLCDGFFRDFSLKAYDKIREQYDEEYVNKFFKNIDKYETYEVQDENEV